MRTPYADLARLAINAAQEHQNRIIVPSTKLQLPDAFASHAQGRAEFEVGAFELGHAD